MSTMAAKLTFDVREVDGLLAFEDPHGVSGAAPDEAARRPGAMLAVSARWGRLPADLRARIMTSADARLAPSGSPFLERDAIAREIARQNPHLAPPPADALYVIAGQQAGLLTGPLYTILKAVSAIGAARRLAQDSGRPVLPLFWIAGEDHDLDEVNRITVNGRRFVFEPPGIERARGRMPQVADIPLDAAREPLLAFLRDALPESEFKPWVLARVAELDFAGGFTAAFRGCMRALFDGCELHLVDPLALRPWTAPVLARLIERWPEAEDAFARSTARLRACGITPPLERLGFFEIVDGARVPVEIDAAGFHLAGGVCGAREAAERVRGEPARFSPGAGLRPVCQDAALPVLAMAAGPSELAYLMQIDALYPLADTRPAARLPRVSATFLEPGVARAAELAGLDGAALFDAPRLLSASAGAATAVTSALGQDDARIAAIEARARALLEALDRLPDARSSRRLRSSRAAIERAVGGVIERLRREQLEAAGLTRQRLEKIAAAVLPDGKPQERVANVTQFLGLHGPEFIARAVEALDPFRAAHRIVRISVERA